MTSCFLEGIGYCIQAKHNTRSAGTIALLQLQARLRIPRYSHKRLFQLLLQLELGFGSFSIHLLTDRQWAIVKGVFIRNNISRRLFCIRTAFLQK